MFCTASQNALLGFGKERNNAMVRRPALGSLPVELHLWICENILEDHIDPMPVKAPWPPTRPGSTPDPPNRSSLIWDCVLPNHAALKNLAQANRYFYNITRSLCYRRVVVSIANIDVALQVITRLAPPTGYGELVRDLTIDSREMRASRSHAERLSALGCLILESQRLRLRPGPNDLTDPLRFKGVLIDVILCQVPNVRKLFLSIYSGTPLPSDPPQPSVVGSAPIAEAKPVELLYGTRFPEGMIFTQLHDLETRPPWAWPCRYVRCSRASISAILRRAPALTRLMIWPLEATLNPIQMCRMPRLSEVFVMDNQPADVATIARNAGQLRHFCIRTFHQAPGPLQIVNPSFQPVTFSFINAHIYLRPILSARGTLTQLCIRIDHLYVGSLRGWGMFLSKFTALRRLYLVTATWPLDYRNQELIDRLPPSLEYLYLGEGQLPLYRLAILLNDRVKRGRFPNLKWFVRIVRCTEIRAELDSRIVSALQPSGIKYGVLIAPSVHDL